MLPEGDQIFVIPLLLSPISSTCQYRDNSYKDVHYIHINGNRAEIKSTNMYRFARAFIKRRHFIKLLTY